MFLIVDNFDFSIYKQLKKLAMKKLFLFCLFLGIAFFVSAQSTEYPSVQSSASSSKTAVDFGVLMGGGSLVGADFEVMPFSRLGLQAGLGISSFGAAVNYHLKPEINSSYISLQYWNQGFGENFYGSYLGPMFVFRAKKIFQAGIGLGYILKKGDAWPSSQKDTGVIAIYNIGVYFPL